MADYIQELPEFLSIFALMLGAFLIGYISAYLNGKRTEKKAIKKIKRQQAAKPTVKDVTDIETIFTEIKPKIIEVVKETQKQEKSNPTEILEPVPPSSKEVKSGQQIAASARENYLNYTKNKPTLNFENFGEASPNDREDLTKINGIGPYIEQRLNEIGIYNYEQISRFKEEDVEVLTELIDFFPGRIERDNWIGQAEALMKH